MKTRWWVVSLCILGLGLASGTVLSQDEGEGQDDEAMMKMFEEMSKPGKEHAILEPLVGNWGCHVKFWMMPGTPAEESDGTMKRRWILGNRYLVEDYEGEVMETPFQGFGLTAYDKLQKRYDAIWTDSMSTGIFRQTGQADASGKTITFTGENFDPMTMQEEWSKSTVEIINNDKHVMKMFKNGPDGKEFQHFEMTCNRK